MSSKRVTICSSVRSMDSRAGFLPLVTLERARRSLRVIRVPMREDLGEADVDGSMAGFSVGLVVVGGGEGHGGYILLI